MTKKTYTISKAVEIMAKELIPEYRSTWRPILKASLEVIDIGGEYHDTLFHWKKVSDNKVMAL